MLPFALDSISDGIGNSITVYETIIIAMQDYEYEVNFGENLKGRRLQIEYRLEIEKDEWKVPFYLDFVENKNGQIIAALRHYSGDLSRLERHSHADSIIRFITILHGTRLDFAGEYAWEKGIATSELIFLGQTQKLFSGSSSRFCITRMPVSKGNAAYGIFNRYWESPYDYDNFRWDEGYEQCDYKFGHLAESTSKEQFSYLILPLRSPWNAGQSIFIGTWEECASIIRIREKLDTLWRGKEEDLRLKAEKEARAARQQDNADYWKSGWQSDYFDAMTDGQLGSYDDFGGNLDDLD
jgi:hypothetical protein